MRRTNKKARIQILRHATFFIQLNKVEARNALYL
jgi:hypothetical protein